MVFSLVCSRRAQALSVCGRPGSLSTATAIWRLRSSRGIGRSMGAMRSGSSTSSSIARARRAASSAWCGSARYRSSSRASELIRIGTGPGQSRGHSSDHTYMMWTSLSRTASRSWASPLGIHSACDGDSTQRRSPTVAII